MACACYGSLATPLHSSPSDNGPSSPFPCHRPPSSVSFPSLRSSHAHLSARIRTGGGCGQSRPRNAIVAATATLPEPQLSPPSDKTSYHFIVANAKFMLDEEEHLQELMRERLRNYAERNKERDFWLVVEPKFLESFPDMAKRLSRPAVAIISTDALWITFMKLRLDRVLKGKMEVATPAEIFESSSADLSFQKPETWTAPYPKYEGPWWVPFLPPVVEQ